MRMWVVAQVKSFDAQGWAQDWDLGGVFTTAAKAREACTEPTDYMWPIETDTFLGRDTVAAPRLTYPAADDRT